MTGTETLIPTMTLRQIRRKQVTVDSWPRPVAVLVLQQGFDRLSGGRIWVDVPIVEEDSN